jgi:iron complex outermembrane receptor protein
MLKRKISRTRTVLMAACAALAIVPSLAQAQQNEPTAFAIQAQALDTALTDLARQSHREIYFSADVTRGKRAPRLSGRMSLPQALDRLLVGSGLRYRFNAVGAIVVERAGAADVGLSPSAAGDDDGGPTLEEIVVTATKSRQRLLDVPVSVTAETGEQLRRRGATQLQDIIATTPGLSNPSPGNGNNTNLVMRGVTTDTALSLKQSTVAMLFDDIPVDPAVSGLLTTNLRIVDVERVEVLRGPQGTLFGSGSLSGAIRYVTNKPDPTRFSGSIEGALTGTKSGADSKWGNVVLNVPLVTDRVAVRAVGYGFDEGGWVDNIALNQANINRNKTYGGRIALTAQATDNLFLSLTGAYQNSHDYADNESLYFQPAGYDRQVTNSGSISNSRAESTLVNLGIAYDFGDVSLFSSSTYIHRKVESLYDAYYYTEFLQSQLGLPPIDDFTPGKTYNDADIYSQELRLASNGSGPFRWTVGAFYLHANTPDGGQTIRSPGVAPYLGTDNLILFETPGKQEELAGFGEATYAFTSKLDVTAGVRVSRTTIDISSIASGILITGSPAALPPFRSFARETAVNPRFSILYRPTEKLSLYAQAARGYRVGGANVTAVLGGPDIPRTYDSDSLWNYEAGVKTSLLNGRLQINADVYYIDWKDLQVSLLANNYNFTGNAGAARLYGLEVEVAAKPASWLDVGGSLSLNNAALTQDTPTLVRDTGVVGVKDGDRLPGSPRTQGSAYVQFNFSLKDDAAFIRASGYYVGPSYTDFASQGIRFGDYGTVDLRAGVVHDNVEVTLFARNLFDSDGKQAAVGAADFNGIHIADQRAYRVRPLTVGLTVRAGF